jgi:hypothetical protein
MQNQTSSTRIAKPQQLHLQRRVAASFNQTVQRTGASRFARRQIERQARLAPVADLSVSHHMRALICFLLWAACLGAAAGQPSTNQSEARLFISAVNDGRPVVSIERGRFSADRKFFEFDLQMSRGWQTNYSVCSGALVQAAQKEHLDAPSLATILLRLLTSRANTNLAILPVAAHSTTQDGALVWIVTLEWENRRSVEELGNTLGHIREFTVTQATLKHVGFSTCR